MAEIKEQSPVLGGFDSISDILNINKTGITGLSENKDPDNNIKEVDPEDIFEEAATKRKELLNKPKLETSTVPKQKVVQKEEIDEQPEEIEEEESNTEEGEVDDLGEYETDVAEIMANRLSNELDIDFGDDKPKSVKEVVDYLKNLVEENSKPQYANEELAKLDEYVRAGGKVQDYYGQMISGKVDLKDVDIDNESHQKLLIREDLSNKGLKESEINKKIERWESSGTLSEEAQDALDSVKEYREQQAETLLVTQKNQTKQLREQQQSFFTNVDKTVKNIKNVAGVPVSEKEKQELLDYIFRPDKDGYSKFSKETGMIVTYNTNPKILFETAYFAKKSDSLVKSIERKVESTAAKNLKQKLANNTKSARGYDQGQDDRNVTSNLIASLSSNFLSK